jgi:hypothetical protein
VVSIGVGKLIAHGTSLDLLAFPNACYIEPEQPCLFDVSPHDLGMARVSADNGNFLNAPVSALRHHERLCLRVAGLCGVKFAA